ncbi:hypothetical protein SBC1_57510 (plasmid) [Caballeronia sp. SBC1]|nr:hypothetical protein SBC2_57120 [Caballeronia sp. SBC2]QIN65705.1 hypothetical protein SBC1_57510 [Caballeronia sp. SBC1]
MPDDNQVDLQGIGEARNLINGIASRKMSRCGDVPLTDLVHSLLENLTGSLFVAFEVDRGQDIKPRDQYEQSIILMNRIANKQPA